MEPPCSETWFFFLNAGSMALEGGGGGRKEGLLLSCPVCVASWETVWCKELD